MGGSIYVLIIVDNCSRFKVTKFVKGKDCMTVALVSYIVDFVTPAGLRTEAIRADNDGAF